MAIPFNLPTEQETEANNHSRLDQLLFDLYEILRLILHRSRGERGVREPPDVELAEPGNALGAGAGLPADLRKPPVPPRRRCRPQPPKPAPNQLPSIWFNVGVQLGEIREVLRTNQQAEDGSEKVTVQKKMEVEGSLLMSILVPSPISGSLWATVILFVGWKLLTRPR